MPVIKEFLNLCDQAKTTHENKNNDYAGDDPFENFERAAIISSWFKNDIDKVFATMIAIKLARLATLLNKDEPPKNEPIEDSFLDVFIYPGLWGSYHKNQGNQDKEDHPASLQIIGLSAVKQCLHIRTIYDPNIIANRCEECNAILPAAQRG